MENRKDFTQSINELKEVLKNNGERKQRFKAYPNVSFGNELDPYEDVAKFKDLVLMLNENFFMLVEEWLEFVDWLKENGLYDELLNVLKDMVENGELENIFNNLWGNEFNKWFESIKDILGEDVAGSLALKILEINNNIGDLDIFRDWDKNIMEKMKNEHYERGVNLKWFGAKGDGNSVLEDTKAFIEASKLNLPIIIPQGDYNVNETIDLCCSIIGIGVVKVTRVGDGSNTGGLFRVRDCEGKNKLEIKNLHLYGGYHGGDDGEWSHGVSIENSKNIEIKNCVIERFYGDCVYIGSKNISQSENIKLLDNKFIEPRRCCIALVSANNIIIKGNYFEDKLYPFVGTIDIEPNPQLSDKVTDVLISNNRYESEIYFINFFNPKDYTLIENIKIKGNEGIARMFCRTGGSLGAVNDVFILENKFYSNNDSSKMFSITINSELKIVDNFDYSEAPHGWSISKSKNPFISGNKILSNKKHYAISFSDCENVTLIDNIADGIYSANGVIMFTGLNQDGVHKIINNIFLNCDYGVVIKDSPLKKIVYDGNTSDCSRRHINVSTESSETDLLITTNNIFTGEGIILSGNILKNYHSSSVSPSQKNTTITYGFDLPSKGNYTRGSIHYKLNSKVINDKLLLGWYRLTSSEEHILNIDWSPLFVNIE